MIKIPVSDDILNVVLSIYKHDDDQPLPSSDEVLMCTSSTTIDEVGLWSKNVDTNFCCLSIKLKSPQEAKPAWEKSSLGFY